jgi:hypothetical protein
MKRLGLLLALAASMALAQAPPPMVNQIGYPTPTVPGSVIILNGTGFTGTTAVNIGTATDGAFQVIGDTEIDYTVPIDGPPGGTLTVIAPGGSFSYSAPVVLSKLVLDAPVCLPNTGNVNTLFNPSTGNVIVSMWCDVASGTFHYALAGSATGTLTIPPQANCLAGVAPFSVSLVWVKQAWNACVDRAMSPSDQAYANRLFAMYVPRPTIKGTGPQTIFTTAANGGLGSPLILGTPQAFQTIPGGLAVGGLRLPGGNQTRYCDVSAYTSDQGNVIPAGSYALCTLVFPPTGGFQYPISVDKSVIKAPTDDMISDGAHHLWGIDAKGIITVDGVEDPTTGGVIELAFVGGLVWQENTAKLWWSKTAPTAAWLPAAGTATAPL